MTTVGLVIATFNRAAEVCDALDNALAAGGFDEVVVVDNGSTDNTAARLEPYSQRGVRILRSDENLGAARGKNLGMRNCTSDVIAVIDDDAGFVTSDPVPRIRECFDTHTELGILQFKIFNKEAGAVLQYEFPAGDVRVNVDRERPIAYFIGAGHAVRRRMMETVGYYPDDFGLYGHEEIDLSYRAIEGGFGMLYRPDIEVYHLKAPGGRLSDTERMEHLLVNRMLMSFRFLPFRYRFVSNMLWTAKTLIDGRSMSLVMRSWSRYLSKRKRTSRRVLSQHSLEYIRANDGRIYR